MKIYFCKFCKCVSFIQFIVSNFVHIRLFLLFIMSCFFPIMSNATLSATSTKHIQGNLPIFNAESATEKLGFILDGKFYSEFLGNVSSTNSMSFDTNEELTFNSFHVSITPDLFGEDEFFDEDGDDLDTFIISDVEYNWFDGHGDIIPPSKYNEGMGCGFTIAAPYKLSISAKVGLSSIFGVPRDTAPVEIQKSYIIDTVICRLSPSVTRYYPMSTIRVDGTNVYSGGYSDDFLTEEDDGFPLPPGYSPNSRFFTTAFDGADVKLVMSSSQGNYTYEATVGGLSATATGMIEINQAEGRFIFRKNPGSMPVVLTAIRKSDNARFSTPAKTVKYWIDQVTGGNTAWAEADNACKLMGMRLPTRIELTNSATADPSLFPAGSSKPKDITVVAAYRRGANTDSFTAQWGGGINGSSKSRRVWTSEKYDESNYFVIHVDNGYVQIAPGNKVDSGIATLCFIEN